MNLNETFLYETLFVNKSDANWRVDNKGRGLVTIVAGGEATIESFKPTTDWARWSKAVKEKDGTLSLTENPAWQNPWQGKFYCLELINKEGSNEESVRVVVPNPACTGGGEYVTVLKGVPKLIPLDLYDPLIKYKAIEWKKKMMKVPIEGTSYFRTVTHVVKEYVPRGKADLKKVLAERATIETEKLNAAHRKMIEKQEKLLMSEGEDA